MANKFRELTAKEHQRARLYGIWPDGFRKYIYNSNNGHCSYCGIKTYFSKKDLPDYNKSIKNGSFLSERECFVIEHVVNNGQEALTNRNLLPVCRSCNSNKQDKKLEKVTNFTLIFGG